LEVDEEDVKPKEELPLEVLEGGNVKDVEDVVEEDEVPKVAQLVDGGCDEKPPVWKPVWNEEEPPWKAPKSF
jgi:hypothetical protein